MKIMEKVKTKAINLKDKAMDIWGEYGDKIMIGAGLVYIGGLVLYFKAYCSGIKEGRSEWDFSNDAGEWAILMEENGDFRTALPIAAIKEVMDKHHTKAWDNSMWRKLNK